MFRVEVVDHIEFYVPDRYEAAKWYQEVFGLEILKDYEFWASEGGPLMISNEGGTKLALFEGNPPGEGSSSGFHRVAFRVDGKGFLAFLDRLKTLNLVGNRQKRLSESDVVDHDVSWSVYFFDPYGYRFELTTYDYEQVKTALSA